MSKRHNVQYLMTLMLESINAIAKMLRGKPFRTSGTHADTNKSSTIVQLMRKDTGKIIPS